MSTINETQKIVEEASQYKYGFTTEIEQEFAPKGLNEDVIKFISKKKKEPLWMLEWRLKAFDALKKRVDLLPTWANLKYEKIDLQDIYYYAAPKSDDDKPKSLNEVDPELLRAYNKLGIPLKEQEFLAGVKNSHKVAVDAVFDSVSVATTFKSELSKQGIIFCSFSEAVANHPDLVKKYLGTVIPINDNYFSNLNSAVFTDGSFVYIPPGVRCPMELSTYFRINAATVQNWYPGDKDGKGGIYNFVTKRGICLEDRSKISWTQVETGSAVTWKYPSVILKGDNSVGEFYSVALSNNCQQADTGTKMIHLGKNTSSRIVSKGISAGRGQQTYRGLVKISPKANNTKNFTQCDSLLIGNNCGAHTVHYIDVRNKLSDVAHEASTSKINDEQLFYCMQRGISEEDATALIVNGFCREVFKNLPMEFAVEAKKLLELSLEGAVG